MEENFKIIPQYPNYEISNLGHLRNFKTKKKIKCHSIHGYRAVRIYLNFPNRKTEYIHRLVAFAFLGYEKDKEVNHKNHIRDDNRLENLEWVSAEYNQIYKTYNNIAYFKEKVKKLYLENKYKSVDELYQDIINL